MLQRLIERITRWLHVRWLRKHMTLDKAWVMEQNRKRVLVIGK